MKKIISIFLSISLLVGASMSVLGLSSQTGLDSDITSMAFDASSYTIKQGDVFDLSEHILAYAGKTQLVQEPIYDWTLQNDSSFAFGIDQTTGIIDVIESKGTATITVTANGGKVKATTKVVAAAAKRDPIQATGFIFEKPIAIILTGAQVEGGTGDTITILPTPTDAYFTPDQINAITSVAVNSLTLKGQPDLVPTIATETDEKIVLKYDLKALYDNKTPIKSASINMGPVAFPTSNGRTVNITRSLRIDGKNAVQSNAIYGVENKTIKVGEKVLLDGLFKQGPSAHNITAIPEYNLDYVDNNAQVLDYADIVMIPDADGNEKFYIQGIRVGKNKVTATIKGNVSAQIIVNVIPTDGKDPSASSEPDKKPSISTSTASLVINQTLTLSTKDITEGKVPTWKLSDYSMGNLSVSSGNSTVFTATKAGVVLVTAMIDGVDIATTTVTITASRPNSTNNPQTSDKILSNLFW